MSSATARREAVDEARQGLRLYQRSGTVVVEFPQWFRTKNISWMFSMTSIS